MAVRLRLARHGRKSRPYYYIVAADSRAPRDGKFVERIGSYNPTTDPATIDLDFDKALSWLQKGAQPSDTVRSLLQQRGVLYKNHLLKGVKKGALTEAQADEKFQAWMDANELKKKEIISKLEADTRSQKKARLAEEEKIKEARAAELAKKRMAEEPAEEGAEEKVEKKVEKVEEVEKKVEKVEEVEEVEEVEKEVEEPAAEEAKEKPNDET